MLWHPGTGLQTSLYLFINYVVIYHSYQKKQDEDMSVN